MWWSRRLVPLVLMLGLAGCGFRPMYGTSSLDPASLDEMASIQIENIPDREGQLIRNALLTKLNPRGEPRKARYNLEVYYTLSESQQALRKDDTATRDVLYYSVRIYLYEGKTPLTAGVITKQLSYDFLEQHYANVSADDDIRRRAAEVIAEEIRNRLVAYFARRAEVLGSSGGGQ